MQFILTNSNMFATNMSYMNDSEEYVNGLAELKFILNDTETIKKWKHKHEKEPRVAELDFNKIKGICTENALAEYKNQCDSYSISFCTKKDLLSQWSMYAKESGVSLTLDFSDSSLLKYKGYVSGTEKSERDELVEKSVVVEPKPVYYFTHSADMGKENQQSIAEKILDDFFLNIPEKTDIYECFEDQWKMFGTYIKRYDFYQENEHRIVFNLKDLRIAPRIDYRNEKYVLKPYLDIECESGWPVTEVTLGPGFNQDAVFKSLRHFLDNADIACHIMCEGDYWKRVEQYMSNVPEIWKQTNVAFPNEITQLKTKIKNQRESSSFVFNKNEIHNMVQKTVGAILNNSSLSEAEKKFFEENYFSVSGIVLRKSNIPYIF